MSNLTKGLVLVVVILAIGLGLVVWKKKVGGNTGESFNSMSREEVEMLLADVAKTNPAAGGKGTSLLLVERGMPGFSVGKRLKKMGMKAQDTSELFSTMCVCLPKAC